MFFFFQAEDGIRDAQESRGLGDVYKRQLLAVANESYRYALAADGTWRQAADAMLAPGAGYDAWLRVRSGHPYGPGGATGGQSLAQIAGFQFVSYTPADAVIQVVTRDSSGNLQVGAAHVTWDGRDW